MLEKILKKIAPYVLAAGISLGLTACPMPSPTPIPVVIKNPVILAIDDFQSYWLSDVQDYVVQKHSENNIPITLGVISGCIEESRGFISQLQNWNSNHLVEIAEHGYNHYAILEGESYDFQYEQIKKGKDLLESIGISPKSFVPIFGAADETSLQVGRDLGFHTFYPLYDYMASSQIINPLRITGTISLWEDNGMGPDAVFKDYNALASEVKNKIKKNKVALIVYHMQDFSTEFEGIDFDKGDKIIDYANRLKREGYTLITAEQYYQSIKGSK